jgi:hypothetical protein
MSMIIPNFVDSPLSLGDEPHTGRPIPYPLPLVTILLLVINSIDLRGGTPTQATTPSARCNLRHSRCRKPLQGAAWMVVLVAAEAHRPWNWCRGAFVKAWLVRRLGPALALAPAKFHYPKCRPSIDPSTSSCLCRSIPSFLSPLPSIHSRSFIPRPPLFCQPEGKSPQALAQHRFAAPRHRTSYRTASSPFWPLLSLLLSRTAWAGPSVEPSPPPRWFGFTLRYCIAISVSQLPDLAVPFLA